MKRVMLLSASAGAGHMRAADAVERALRATREDVEVRSLDVLTLASPAFREAYSTWYLELVNRAPAPEVLAWKVDVLLGDTARMESMRKAAARIARPGAAERIARWALGRQTPPRT